MATDSSKDRPKRPNGTRTSISNRDKPLFSSMRRPPNHQDFTTESLNTTFIPSPSPAKSQVRSPTLAKPRQARGHTRGFSDALKAYDSKREEPNKSNEAKRKPAVTRHAGKPSPSKPSHKKTEASSNPPPKPAPSRNAARTPSPRRNDATQPLATPTSEAPLSPGGIEESYQHILDDAYLAAQEGSAESLADEDASEIPQDINDGLHSRLQASPTPSPRRSSRRALQMMEPQTPQEEADKTLDIGSSDSSPDVTRDYDLDDHVFSRGERDEQRVSALTGDDWPFKKAKRRSRLSLSGLKRDDASSHSGSSSIGSNATGSILSDPALNIPSQWGRKGRHGRTWLNRINDENVELEAPQSNEGSHMDTDKKKFKAIEDWQAAAASTPLPPVAESDSLQRDSPLGSEVRNNTGSPASRDRTRRSVFGEIGLGRSSTLDGGPPKMRNLAIDMIREREIQNLTKSAVTTNRLGELREKRSLDRIGRRSPSASAEALLEQGQDNTQKPSQADEPLPVTRPLRTSSDSDVLKMQSLSGNDLIGVPIPDSPVVVYSSRSATPTQDESSEDSKPQRKRPPFVKDDSREILRQLARVSSPEARAKFETSKVPFEKNSRSQSLSVAMESSESPAEEPVKEPPLIPSQPDSEQQAVHSTPQPTRTEIPLKTPQVTGAWIDTPMPTIKQTRSTEALLPSSQNNKSMESQEPLPKEQDMDEGPSVKALRNSHLPLEETAPKLPKSALSAIVERAKEKKRGGVQSNNDDTLLLDDSTIESLEELLASSADDAPASASSQPTSVEPSSNTLTRPTKNSTSPKKSITGLRKEQKFSPDDYNHLTSQLTRLQSSITNAKNDVGTLQKRMRRKLPPDLKSLNKHTRSSSSAEESECDEAGEFHDFIWPCEKCNRAHNGDEYADQEGSITEWQWRPVQVLIPKLWTWPKGLRSPRLTRLGWWGALVLALVVLELILW